MTQSLGRAVPAKFQNVAIEKRRCGTFRQAYLHRIVPVGHRGRVGRHNAPDELPAPKDKPRYRLVLAIGGIFLLAFVSMAVVAAVFPERGLRASAAPKAPADGDPAGKPFPSISAGPAVGTPPSSAPLTTVPARPPARTAAGRPASTKTTAPPAGPTPTGPVAGSYKLATDWTSGFIAAVTLTNSAQGDQSWQVTLLFPDNVGALQAQWIAGGPGNMTVARAGQTVTFTSEQPLAAGRQIEVTFQFDKTAAGSPSPRTCSVNGFACTD
jgi:hypothetical protein